MKILVAEDEMIMLKTIELRLKKDGHEIINSSDGRGAILKIDETLHIFSAMFTHLLCKPK